jgi:hypothetical protein
VHTDAGKPAPVVAAAGAIRRAVHLRPGTSKPAFAVGLWFGIMVVRPWYAIRRAIGWRQANRRQRLTVVLGGLCALSVVAGAAVAAAGVGNPGPPVPGLDPPQMVAANQAQTAAWIAQQVSPGTVVTCEPTMCNLLRGQGFPAAQLTVLPSAPAGPLPSGLVVATATVRDQFGTRLTRSAPMVLARFGSGAAAVDVREVAPTETASAHAALVSAGQQLLRDRNIQAAPAARPALLAGRVDPRLLANLSVLAASMPIRLVAFDELSPGADPAVPLRGAEIEAVSPAASPVILSFLRAQQGAYAPSVTTSARDTSGPAVITVWFQAPGLIGAGPR